MGREYYTKRLISINDINEELSLIEGSNTDYVTPSGKIYKKYNDSLYFEKKTHVNKHNGYVYVGITYNEGINKARRLHVLVAKAFIYNPDPIHFKIVGHKDDNKQNNIYTNLYWTDTRENTQSAVNHGLAQYKKCENSEQSVFIKVLDKNTKEIVGVYGSIHECARCIENVTTTFISKMYKKENYKPRHKKYIYQIASQQEFEDNFRLRSTKLIENPIVDKMPKVFWLINDYLGYIRQFDNQVVASEICNIPQPIISKMIRERIEYYGWRCEFIKSIKYTEASSYKKLINSLQTIMIKNIITDEIKYFETCEEFKKFLGISGNNIRQYYENKHIAMNEWKIIDFIEKETLQKLTTGENYNND